MKTDLKMRVLWKEEEVMFDAMKNVFVRQSENIAEELFLPLGHWKCPRGLKRRDLKEETDLKFKNETLSRGYLH